MSYWTQDQIVSIKEQLEAGSRCLDIRSGDLGPEYALEDRFIFVHGGYQGSGTQYDSFVSIREQVDLHPFEFYILDVHKAYSLAVDIAE